VVVEMGW